MGQVLQLDSIAKLIKLSGTQVSLGPSVITVGGQQYRNVSSLLLDTSISGVGGIDTGGIVANKLFYVYAVINAGALALIATQNKNAPLGFTAMKEVGRFVSEATPVINYVYGIDQKQFEVGPSRVSNGAYTGGSGFQPLTIGNPTIDLVAKESGTFKLHARIGITIQTSASQIAYSRVNCFAGGTPTNQIDLRAFFAKSATASPDTDIPMTPELICDLVEGVFYQFQFELNCPSNCNGDLSDPGGVAAMTGEQLG